MSELIINEIGNTNLTSIKSHMYSMHDRCRGGYRILEWGVAWITV